MVKPRPRGVPSVQRIMSHYTTPATIVQTTLGAPANWGIDTNNYITSARRLEVAKQEPLTFNTFV